MVNKKGLALEDEFVKVVVSVIGIAILFLLGVKLYGLLINDASNEQAEANLNNIYQIYSSLEGGEESSYIIESPQGWVLTGFFYGLEETPLKCSGDCLCICEDREDCFENGFCRNVDSEFKLEFGRNYLELEELPKEIVFKKINNTITISENAD